MPPHPSIGYFSPFLSDDQKTALQELEQALVEERSALASTHLKSFLQMSFEATLEAVLDLRPSLDRATLAELADEDSEEAHVLSQLLWNGEALSPFGEGLLTWHEGAPESDDPCLSLEQLNSYLVASADFYSSRRGLFPSHETEPITEPQPASLSLFPHEDEDEDLPEEAPPEAEPPEEAPPEEPTEKPQLAVEPSESDEPLDNEIAAASPEEKTSSKSSVEKPPAVADSEDSLELLELAQAPLSPLEAKSQLVLKKKYLGYGKNSDGVMGYCGQLTLSRFDDKTLNATLESSNPLLFLSTSSVNAAATVVTYWMPPAAFPQPGGHLVVESPEGKKVLSVSSLFPQSRTDFLQGRQVALLLLAPALLGLVYFGFVYLYSSYGILSQVKEMFPEQYAAALSGQGEANFRAEGVGLYQLEVVPASESLQLIVATMIWLAPLASTKFFRHLSRSRKRAFGGLLASALILPSLGMLAAWTLQRRLFPLFEHPDFAPLDLRGFLPWALPLNLAAAAYLFLSVHGVWDRKLRSELRFLLPALLSVAYLVICFLLIFGRSWLS